MLWRLLQASVALAVIWANIRFQWTNNGFIAIAWAFMAAYAVTAFPFWLADRWRYRRSLSRQSGKAIAGQRRLKHRIEPQLQIVRSGQERRLSSGQERPPERF
jgi:hypothetical protein